MIYFQQYDIKSLKIFCEEFLSNNLTVENCFEALELAEMYKAEHLQSNAIDFLVQHPGEVKTTGLWEIILIPDVRLPEAFSIVTSHDSDIE